MKRIRALLTTLALAGTVFSSSATGETRWDMPTAYPANNFHTENIQLFAKDVDRLSGGNLKITVHSNGSKFKAPEIKRAVEAGNVQIGEILLANFESEDPIYSLDSVPFLATSYVDSLKLYKASRKSLEDRLAKQGLKLLFSVPWPPQGIFTNRSIASITDMKDLKWRANSPEASKFADLVGAQPVIVPAADVSRALSVGIIDSYLSSGATGYDSRLDEHLKYFYDIRAWLPKDVVIVNRAAFDALDTTARAVLLKAATDAENRGWKLSEDKNAWYLEQLRIKGMTIVIPPEQLAANLRRAGNYMLAEWLRKAGADGRRIVDAYRAM